MPFLQFVWNRKVQNTPKIHEKQNKTKNSEFLFLGYLSQWNKKLQKDSRKEWKLRKGEVKVRGVNDDGNLRTWDRAVWNFQRKEEGWEYIDVTRGRVCTCFHMQAICKWRPLRYLRNVTQKSSQKLVRSQLGRVRASEIELEFEVLVFVQGGRPESPGKNPRSKDENQQQTQSIYGTGRKSNPGHICGRRAHSPLRHPCSPK